MSSKNKKRKCAFSECSKEVLISSARLSRDKTTCCSRMHRLLYIKERSVTLFWEKVDKTPGLGPNGDCWVWTGNFASHGYGSVTIQGKTYSSHRLSWQWANNTDYPPSDMHVCHTCDYPSCVNPKHLWLGTPKQNMQDMAAKGRGAAGIGKWGEENIVHKLTEKQVIAIWEDLKSQKYHFRILCDKYQISFAYLSKIASGEAWKHLGLYKLEIIKKLEKGEDRYNSVLTKEQVINFKKYKLMGYGDKEAARMSNFSNLKLAYNISNNAQWKDIVVTEFTFEDEVAAERLYNTIDKPKCGQRLSIEIAREIRELYGSGKSITTIAKQFGVSIVTIGKIVRNLTWKEEYDKTN